MEKYQKGKERQSSWNLLILRDVMCNAYVKATKIVKFPQTIYNLKLLLS